MSRQFRGGDLLLSTENKSRLLPRGGVQQYFYRSGIQSYDQFWLFFFLQFLIELKLTLVS